MEFRKCKTYMLWLCQYFKVLFIAVLSSNFTWAQNYEALAPKEVPAHEAAKSEIYTDPEFYTQSLIEEPPPIVKSLRGVVFVSSLEMIRKEGREDEGIVVEGLDMLHNESFNNRIIPLLGQPVSLALLNEITREVVLHYRQFKRPVVDAVVPEQDIQSGVIQVLVVESRVGEIRVDGNKHFSGDLLLGKLRIKRGDEIDSEILLKDLQWINENPFRQVDVVYSRGLNQGETDITLNVRDKFPFRFYTGYENNGNILTGLDRYLAGVNWGNAFGKDHLLSYQFTGSSDFERVRAHSLSYNIPVDPWSNINLYGSFAESSILLGRTALDGRNWQAGFRYNRKFPEWKGISNTLSAGFDFKESNTAVGFGVLTLSDSTNQVNNFVVEHKLKVPDPYGITSFNSSLFISPGNLSDRNNDTVFQSFSNDPDAESDYYYGKWTLDRRTRLPKKVTWVLKGGYQLTSANLLPSEQVTLGGKNTVRGYVESETNADTGYWFSTELIAPSFSFSNLFNRSWNDQMQYMVFFDYGYARNKFETSGTINAWEIYSTGTGVRYLVNPHISMQMDWGYQLKESANFPDDKERAHISLSVSY